NITNDSTPTFTLGNIDADVTDVQVLINGTGHSAQLVDGKWQFTAPALADGNYTVTVQVTDDAGNIQRSAALDMTIDTVTAVPVITLTDDTGVQGDSQTNDTTPVFAITTDNDAASVMVSIDGGLAVAAIKDADGKWHFTSGALADGDHSISVTVTDLAGNTSSASLTFTVDTTLSVPTIDLADASDSGSSSTDNITNDSTPTFTLGNIDADVTDVQVLINGTAYTVQQVGGVWQFTAPVLTDGDYSVIVKVTDDAGNTRQSPPLSITVDTVVVAPVITLSDDTGVLGDNQTNVDTPTFAIRTDVDVVSVMVSIDGGAAVPATLDSAGQWRITSSKLVEGNHSISVMVTDNAGNTSSSSLTFNIDTTLSTPTVDLADTSDSGISNTDNITNDNTPAFKLGNIDPDVTDVQVILNGTVYDAQLMDGVWIFNAPVLADGDYTVVVKAIDDAGNERSSSPVTVTIDTDVQPVTIALDKNSDTGSSATDNYTSDTTPTFNFSNIPADVAGTTLTINGKQYAIDLSNGTSFTLPDALPDGNWTATVTVVDIAGNQASSQLNFTIDTEVAKPTIDLVAGSDSGDSQTDDLTNTAKPQFRLGGVDVDDCDFVTIVISGTDGKYRESWTVSAKDYGEELWNCPVSLSDSSYQITVTTSDLAGNKQSSDALNFEIDTVTSINSVVLLDDTGSSTTDNLTNVNTPEFAISAPDDVTHVSILIDGKVAGSAIKQADGKWHFTAGELADGAHTLSVTVTDKAGNISQQELAFTVDTTLSTPTLTLTGESDSGYSNSDHITNDVRPTFIIGNVDSDVVSVTLNINGQSWPVTIKDGIGEFTVPVDLADGVWQAELIVVDNAGNTRSSTMSITIDTVTSVDAIVLQSDTGVQNDWMTNETKPTFAITAPSDAQTVVVTVGSMTQNAVNQDGKWVITLPSALSDGEYTLHVTVTDKAGNTADRTQNFTIDTTLEPLTVQLTDEDDSGIVDDNITNVTTPSFIMGNIPEDVYSIEVILNGVKTTLTPQSDGRWLYTPDSALAEGNYTLQAVVTDNAGNQRTTSYAFTVDTTVKISSITLTTDTGDSSTDDVTNASQPVFRVTTSDDVISVVATLNGVPCTVVKNSDGEWTVTSSVLSTSGEYTLNVTVQDVAGNETSSTKTITFDNSLSMPVVAFAAGDDTGYDDGDHLTADNKPSFVITNVDSDVTYISVTLNGRTTPLTQDAKGNWIFTPSSTLSDGDYTLTVDVQDLAGNTRQQNFSFTIDTTLSTPTIDMNTASDTGDLTDDNLTSNTRPQFTIGNVDSDIYSVVVTLNNVDYTLTKNTQGQWAFQAPTLTDGIYTLEVTVTDKAGNVRSSSLDFEVDTITAIDSIIMSEDTGYSSVDHLTKDTQPSFEINVPDDVSHVTVTLDNGTAVELVKSNGKWVYSVEGVLEDGSHRLVVEVVDKAGNKASDTFTFEVDTTLHPVTIDLATADDSGSSPMDNYTNVTQPTFTFGSIDSDAYSLVVTLNGKTYNVDLSSKPVSFTPPDVLADGTYTMSAVITDKAGNAQETTLSFTIDTHTSVDVDFVVGDDTGYSDSDNITNNNAPNFEVIVPSDVESVTVVLNGVTTILTQDETGRWLYQTPSLVDGHYDLQINVVDKAGNTASKTLSFEVDTTLNTPTIDLADVSDTGTSSNDSLTKDNTPYFVIGNIDSDAHSVTVSINNKTYNASLKDGVWGLQIPEADALVDGVYTATVRVEDNAGNVKTASTTITVDTFCPAPIVELDDATNSGSTDDNITNITQPVINISGEPADIASVTVSIGSQSWTLAPGTTQWMVPDALPDGSYNIVVAFTDNAGNKGTTTYNVVVDTVITSPTVVLLDDTGSDAHDNLTNVAAPRFQIYAAEDLAAVSVTLNGRTTSLVQNDKGQWIYTADTLADGTWTLTVDMYDLAGNYHSDTLTFTIDTQIPQPTIDLDSASDSGSSDSDNLTNITQPKFIISGIPDDVDSVSVQIGGVKYAAIQDGNGEWSVTPAKLADGDYTATVTVTDKAGNASSNAIDFTIDTKIALSVDMRATSDTGDSQTDRLTHDTSPTFGGVTDKDAKLTISVTNDKGEVIQTLDVMPAADGTWSVTLGDLVDGSYTITVTAVDRAGNQATASQNFEIDTIVSAPVVALSASDPENYHEALSLTPEFSGTAEPGSTLKIMIDGVSVGSVTTDSNGSWAWTPPSAMTAGDHIIGVIATDKAGNISDRTDFTFIIPLIDVDLPTLQLQTDSDSGAIGDFITNDTTPTLTGISLPGNTVTIYIDGKVAGTAPTDSTGRYNFNLPEMAEGTYSIVVSIVNPNNGEEVKSSPASLVVDTHVEPLTWDIAGMNEAGYINTSSPTVHGTSEAGARIVVMVDGNVVVETVAASDGTWLASMPNVGSDGEHELSFTVTDVAGNATDFGPQTFIVDTYITPITVDLRDADDTGSSATDNITRNTLVHLDGSAEANAIITIANAKGEILATVTADDNGNWSSEIALQEGNQTFIVTETDIAGNTASKSIDITCDTQNSISAVVLSRDSNSADTNDSITNVNTPTLTAATDPMSSVDIYVNGVLMATVTADAAGSVSWTMPESADGTYAVKMVSTDTAGNIATSDTAVVVIDTVIDSFSVDALPELTNKTGLNVSGTGEVGATVMLYLDGVAVGQGTVNADGIWDIQVILSKDGDYTLTTTITDAAGNTLSSDPFLFTLDSKTDYPTIKLDDASNSGSLSDTITNDNTPSFHGTAEAGATVSILVNEVVVATVTADAQGQWTWQYPATFADGEYSIRVIAEDAAGNTADSARMLLTVDTSTWIEVDKMTTDSGFYNNDYYTSKVIPTFQINGETGQPVDVYIDGKYVETITITGRNYLYTVPEALGDGKHTIRFDISDAAGNTASTGERTFTIDTVNNTAVTLDTINGESIADHTVNDTIYINDLSAGVKFSGTAEENSYVTVTINGMTVSQVWANDQGGWSVNINSLLLSDSNWNVKVTSQDKAGNSTSSTFSIVVDTSISQFTANVQDDKDSSIDKWTVNSRTPTFNGVGEAGATVTLLVAGMVVATTTVAADGTWSITTDQLSEGNNALTFKIEDPAGNTQEIQHDLLVDSVVPTVPTIEISTWNSEGSLWILSGHAEAGTTVVIKDEAGNILNTVTVSSSGSWSTAISYPDGGKITVQAQDSATNISDPVALDVMFTTPVIALDTASDSGLVGDSLTNDSTPTFVLSNVEKDVVSLSVTINGKTVQATQVSTGVWSVTWTEPLVDGLTNVQIKATDGAGNTASQSWSFTVDTFISAATIVLNADSDTGVVGDNITQNPTPGFTLGNIDADVTKVEVTLNGVTSVVVKDEEGNWIYTPDSALTDGKWTLDVKVTDAAGNTAHSSLDFTIDTGINTPVVTLDAQSDTGVTGDNLSSNPQPGFVFTNVDADVVSVQVTLNGKTYNAVKGDTGSWTFTPDTALPDGKWTLDVNVTDTAGNTACSSLDFTIDTTISTPVVSMDAGSDTGVAGDNITSNAQPAFTLSNIDADATQVQVTVNGKTYDAEKGESGDWTFTPETALPDGQWTLDVKVTDAAGNTAHSSLDFTIDTTISTPVVTMDAGSDTGVAGDNITSNTQPAFILSDIDADVTRVQVTLDGNTYDAVKDESGNWTFTPDSPLAEGHWTLEVNVTDTAGNTASQSVDFTVDNHIETFDVTFASNSGQEESWISDDSTLSFTGHGEAGADITVKLDNGDEVTTRVNQEGNWNIDIENVDKGTHELVFTITDQAGNTSSYAHSVDVETDTPALLQSVRYTEAQDPAPIEVESSHPVFEFSLDADVTHASVELDGTVYSLTPADSGPTVFEVPVALEEGPHTLVLQTKDNAGNSERQEVPFTVDTSSGSVIASMDEQSQNHDDSPQSAADAETSHQAASFAAEVMSITPSVEEQHDDQSQHQ
ncbi:TPA: Ig-like domain repeat protein, partial [Enterobacter asburiae]|nr:Ig-like domain repeat protein [Enterobacter asburiae]